MNKIKPKWKEPDNRRVYRKTQSKHSQLVSRGWLAFSITTIFLIKSAYAGFACLNNPCVFGVCIDDLNRYISKNIPVFI